jgi:hypothetical protein
MQQDELEPLRKAVEGLTYPSESDEPFDVVRWDAKGTAHDQVAANAGNGKKIEPVPVDAFFSQLDDSNDADRFHALRRVLQSTLTDLQIFRAADGGAEVDVYLIGRLPSGAWAGLHTISVET